MARLLIVLCICVFQFVFTQFVPEDQCETVDNTLGTCLNIKLCDPYLKVLENFGSRPEVQTFLRKTTCGFEGTTPKVCCPRQFLQPITTNPLQPPTTSNPLQPATVTLAPGRSLAKSLPTDDDYISAFPSPPECGISNASFGRIVGGVDAKLGDLPWMALLGYEVRSSLTSWLCGGSLVSRRHVITAAHCIHNQETALYVVRLGELDLGREDEGAAPVDILIKSMTKHEQYDPKSYENDIGVLVLQNDVQYSELIKPICIPATSRLRSEDFLDWMPLVAGWGQLSARGAKATHLQVLQLPVLSNDVCLQSYSQYEDQVIDERVICAGYITGGKDSCSGDSGGPLMQPIPINLTSIYYQIGVVSFGPRDCARPGLPGIYTRVTNFIPWLQRYVLGSA
ncbi:venom protease-like [Maniola hyperantus]|uniref:venom protease-like n=1 Tax=Aphantopus hyperantus TaxID=2795564 RepID=UPI001567E2DA|nr:venom protease-like [Maniola hyperantus]